MIPGGEIFLQEAAELLESLERDLLALETDEGNAALVDSVFRSLHTLKGSGDIFGFGALARFVHGLENAFDQVRSGNSTVSPELIEVALSARDHIQALLATGGDEAAERELEASPTAKSLNDRIAALEGAQPDDRPASGDMAGAPAPAAQAPHVYFIRFTPSPTSLRNGMRPELMVEELSDLGECRVLCCSSAVPMLEQLDAASCYLSWEITLTTARGRDAVDAVFLFADPGEVTIEDQGTAEARSEEAPAEAAAGETPATSAQQPKDGAADAAPSQPATANAAPAKKTESIRVQSSRLDDLMDQLGELVIAQSRLNRLAEQLADQSLAGAAEEIERLVTGLRDTTLSIRMLPIELVFGKFRRVVRDLSGELGKSVHLITSGGETEVDKNVIDSLTEPLVHIIRNAIDHGIESPEKREAIGKPTEARLTLSARQSAGEVLVSVSDDGGGLNLEAIRERALARGLLSHDDKPSDSELAQMIFRPGFSTATAVSNLSGRGVGMDAVRRVVEDLRGAVEVSSEPGQGTSVTLRFPLTLAIIDGLMVRVASNVLVIPLSNVEECVELDVDNARRESGRTLLNIRNELVSYVDLATQLKPGHERAEFPRVVIIGTDTGRMGLVVDDILGQHQTVIKSLSAYHRAIPGLSGATILSDGTVGLILDVGALVKSLTETANAA